LVIKTLDPDPQLEKMLEPDPQLEKMLNPDPPDPD
jgi:hypothetical protein